MCGHDGGVLVWTWWRCVMCGHDGGVLCADMMEVCYVWT